MSDYAKGIETLKKLIGEERTENVIERFKDLSPAFENEAISVVFGRTWSRDAIDAKTRSLCSIGILSALGRHGALRIVFGIALSNGATVEEITEALLQVAIYAGYPAALDALPVLQEVLKEKGIAHDVNKNLTESE
ncbi:MAG: carboxymuconolactone decarboxylase family protein [Candidatus Thiodiazotropha sp. (ex Notomyrtea botanica)]|nr:carboxymuconolactone decarboxylase family protein [Candidatus Thiodiazotropha sp. (ex Notomyrtea botanica)]